MKPLINVALLWLLVGHSAAQAADNLHFTGALVQEACTIRPGDEELQIDLGATPDKYLYLNQRTRGKPFSLHLENCDPALGNTLEITFSGNESAALPGLLTPDAGSQARGIAIGLETPQGQALPFNQPASFAVQVGSNQLDFLSYIAGEPDAIKNKNISRGLFTASGTFTITYY
ncbi:fimbrial protein [Pantoea dispersa]|uniref:fimbrial protein n=1 Tax=Pantoea dispersa TaxID=59814 RepID=UPI0028DEABFA|nr:fimbrial protein [Pantoea dispersa]MDT8852922.1 fimbrial protein [Pantoea dispersa]